MAEFMGLYKCAGIDIGSRTIKLCVLDEGRIEYKVILPSTFDPMERCREILRDIEIKKLVATGYGRKLFEQTFSSMDVSTITEIQAFAIGAFLFYPQARTVLDIGGQDTKVIALSDDGRVTKFEMNDRCSAGTGKFLEIMASSMMVPIELFGTFALKAEKKVVISSMCTVFAQSEVTSLIARGERGQNIALGVHQSIIHRTRAMLSRVSLEPPFLFAGGVAHNVCMCELLKESVEGEVIIPENPDFIGAIGAAWQAQKNYKKI